jgi:hypothetical protein
MGSGPGATTPRDASGPRVFPWTGAGAALVLVIALLLLLRGCPRGQDAASCAARCDRFAELVSRGIPPDARTLDIDGGDSSVLRGDLTADGYLVGATVNRWVSSFDVVLYRPDGAYDVLACRYPGRVEVIGSVAYVRGGSDLLKRGELRGLTR